MWMTDILTCLRCNHLIAFWHALIQCVHCGFVAWYRAESATGTISYKQTPPTSTRPGTDIPNCSLSHMQTQAVNDLSSDPKPSYIMSDSPMKPMIINVNVHTSSIIQTAKTHLTQVSITPLLRLRCEHADTTICSHFHISSRNKNEPCANLRFRHSSPRFRNGSSPAWWRAWKKRKRKNSTVVTAPHFFWNFFWNQPERFFEISRSLEVETMESGMTEPSIHEPSEVWRRQVHVRYVPPDETAIIVASHISSRACWPASSQPHIPNARTDMSSHTLRASSNAFHARHGFSMRDARCFAFWYSRESCSYCSLNMMKSMTANHWTWFLQVVSINSVKQLLYWNHSELWTWTHEPNMIPASLSIKQMLTIQRVMTLASANDFMNAFNENTMLAWTDLIHMKIWYISLIIWRHPLFPLMACMMTSLHANHAFQWTRTRLRMMEPASQWN